MNYTIQPFQKKIKKPWGSEIIYTHSDSPYTGKILHVRAGCQLSFQYHDKKQETVCLYSGEAILWLEDATGKIQKLPMIMHYGYVVFPMQKHRIIAIQDTVVLESSLPERGITFRIEDDYNRTDENEASRSQENRG